MQQNSQYRAHSYSINITNNHKLENDLKSFLDGLPEEECSYMIPIEPVDLTKYAKEYSKMIIITFKSENALNLFKILFGHHLKQFLINNFMSF